MYHKKRKGPRMSTVFITPEFNKQIHRWLNKLKDPVKFIQLSRTHPNEFLVQYEKKGEKLLLPVKLANDQYRCRITITGDYKNPLGIDEIETIARQRSDKQNCDEVLYMLLDYEAYIQAMEINRKFTDGKFMYLQIGLEDALFKDTFGSKAQQLELYLSRTDPRIFSCLLRAELDKPNGDRWFHYEYDDLACEILVKFPDLNIKYSTDWTTPDVRTNAVRLVKKTLDICLSRENPAIKISMEEETHERD